MSPTVLLVTDRSAFEDAWRETFSKVRPLEAQISALHPDALATSALAQRAFVIDAGSAAYDEDELLAATGMLRALRAAVAVVLPEAHKFEGVESLLEDLCAGLLVRHGD